MVYSKRPFAGPAVVLRYLSLYTHRVAVGDRRILNINERAQTLRLLYKDYAQGGRKRRMSLSLSEFLRRFCLHILPGHFVKIRHYGILSNRHRSQCIAMARELIARASGGPDPAAAAPALEAISTADEDEPPARCPWCGSPRLHCEGHLLSGPCHRPVVLYAAACGSG